MKKLNKIVVICGPTATGKTALGLSIAKKFNGEIVNADSRQIYKRMNIGTEKPEGIWTSGKKEKIYLVQNIPHHLTDIIEPNQDYSLAEYKESAIQTIEEILGRNKLPIIVGGTGLYISAVVDNLNIPKVAPSRAMREEFEKKPLAELVEKLKQLDPESANKIDIKNPRRVIRALEVAIVTGKSFSSQNNKSLPLYDALEIGISFPKEILIDRAEKRVDEQIKRGLIGEVEHLLKHYDNGFWVFSSTSSIGYREIGNYLTNRISKEEAIELIKKNTRNYIKRQITWFKRNDRIKWVANLKEAEGIVNAFIR